MADDPFHLQRFLDAQDAVYGRVVEELASGHKTGHWMWFVFPQVTGLGHSATAQHYAISSIKEACAYVEHPVLGSRLKECVNLLLGIEDRTAEQILGGIDAVKLRSCLTLFFAASGGDEVFEEALERYFDGVPDLRTLSAIR